MRYEESFGIIPLRKEQDAWIVFLIQHQRSGYWGFPKGHAEGGESPRETAFRELKEETNLDVVQLICKEPLMEQYQFLVGGKRVSKRVSYYVAEVSGEIVLQAQEIQDGAWAPLAEALDKVTHKEGKSILAQVVKLLS